jgi:hypothetical protein
MSKNKTVIIERFPSQTFSEAYLKTLLASCNSCGGYAVQTKNEAGHPVIVSDRMDTGAEVEAVQQLIAGYPDSRILLTFSHLDDVNEKRLQPYDLTVDGKPEDVLLSFALEGSFLGKVESDLAHDLLIPSMRKFLKLSAGKLDDFIAELRDPTFIDNIMSRIDERGEYCFLPPVGDAIWYGKNTLGSTFPWGRVSNTLGYTETPAKVTETKADKKKGWWSNTGPALPVAEDKPVETKPAETAPPVPLNVPADKPDTKIDPPPAKPGDQPAPDVNAPPPTGHWEPVPKGLSNKDRKAYIRRMTNCGSVLPEGYDKPDFMVWVVDYPKPARDLKELAEKMQVPAPITQQKPKDMRGDAPRPAPTKGSETQAAEASAMILSADEKSRAESSILKIMDRQGKTIPSPLEIQKAVAKYPVFTKQMGVDLARVRQWMPEDLISFSKDNGKAFCHLLFEAFGKINELETQLAVATSGPSDTKVEDTIVTTQPEPEKKVANAGGWSW